MARVMLIKSLNTEIWPLEVTPPLGLLYLAAALRARGHQVGLMDLRLSGGLTPRQVDEITAFEPSVVGFSALSGEAPEVHRAAQVLRAMVPSCERVVVGGPYASSSPGRVLEDGNIDAAIAGEGETALAALVEAWEAGKSPARAGLPGILYRDGDKVAGIRNAGPPPDVDSYPLPAWDLISFASYAGQKRMCGLRPARYAPVFTSRSCPYSCIYCHKVFGKGFRPRSVENVMEGLSLLVEERGIRDIDVIDDIFNLDCERAMAICEAVASRGWKLRVAFPNGLRADLLDRPLLAAMKAAGVYFMAIPVESASERIQVMIRKNLDLGRVNRTTEICRDLGIMTFGFFMLGFPTETGKEMEETVRFACRSKLNMAGFNTVTAYEGTELWKMAEARRKEREVGESSWNFTRTRGNLSELDDRSFARMKRNAFFSFYAGKPQRLLSSGTLRNANLRWGPEAFLRKMMVSQ